MSTDHHNSAPATPRRRDVSQFGLAAAIGILAVVILINTADSGVDFAAVDPVGPSFFPRIVAGGLLLTSVWLAIATWRGDVPEAEEGEDVDLTAPTDWKTLGMLVSAFVFLIATLNLLGWTIASAIFYTVVTYVLGSRSWVRNLLIGVALGILSFYVFYSGLGIMLPAGILDGIL